MAKIKVFRSPTLRGVQSRILRFSFVWTLGMNLRNWSSLVQNFKVHGLEFSGDTHEELRGNGYHLKIACCCIAKEDATIQTWRYFTNEKKVDLDSSSSCDFTHT